MKKIQVLTGPIRKKDFVRICQSIPRDWKVTALKRNPDKSIDVLFSFAGEFCRLSLGRYALQQKFQTIWNAWHKYCMEIAVESSQYFMHMKLNERSFFEQIMPCVPVDPVARAAHDKAERERDSKLNARKRKYTETMANLEATQLAYRRKKIATWCAKGIPLSGPPAAKTFAELLNTETTDD